MTITRPLLRYYGSGWARAPWIVEHFPPHDAYLEPCLGAGSILFHKRKAKLETVGDLDGRVINFFNILRERPKELTTAVELTPWAEMEFIGSTTLAEDPLEDARRFFFGCWASIRGGPIIRPSDFRFQKKLTRRSAAVKDMPGTAVLLAAATRLKNVQILKRDALALIKDYNGTGCLIYFDPPYVASRRANKNGYRYEVDDSWHEEAAYLLRGHDGPVIVSGYNSTLYGRIYEDYGWKRAEKQQRTNSGGAAVECIWLSPDLRISQPHLFDLTDLGHKV